MSGPRIVAVAGSLSAPSRTQLVTSHVAGRIAARSGGSVTLVDVATLAPDLGRSFSRPAVGSVETALKAIEQAHLIVAGSPVYKGSYAGFFKHLVDLIDYRALAGVPVALLATGGSDRHALVVEHHMRPLFASFDAHTLPTAVFVVDRDVESDGRVTDERVAARIDALIREAAGAVQRPAVAA